MFTLSNKAFWLFIALFSFYTIKGQEKSSEIKTDSVPEYIKLYQKASTLTDSGRYKEAMPLFKKVLKENPDYYMAYNKLALIAIKQEKYKDAEKNLAKAEQISPINFDSQKLRGIMYYLTEQYSLSKPALDSAYSVAVLEKIDDPELYFYQASLMFKGKSYKSAIGVCNSALELHPKYLDVIKLKAEIRFTMKDYQNAIKDLDDAINAMNEKNMDYNFYKMRAKSKFNLRDYKGAIKDWSAVLDSDPKDEEALISRANCKINTGDNTGAIVDLDAAIKINSKNPVSWCHRGVAKGGNKSNVEALKDLDMAIKLKFDYAEAYFRRAAIKLNSKDKQGACDDLQKADSLGDPDAFKMVDKFCKGR